MSSTPASSPTSGRWIVDESRLIVSVSGTLESGQSRKAIGCAYFPAGGTNHEMEANAALFAAAKTMLSTLRRMEATLEQKLDEIRGDSNASSYVETVDLEDALGDVRSAIKSATTIGAPQ